MRRQRLLLIRRLTMLNLDYDGPEDDEDQEDTAAGTDDDTKE